MGQLREKIKDRKVLGLIRRYLEAGVVMPDGARVATPCGAPQDVIDELRRYITGWLNYFGISHTYTALLELDEWVRRRVRLYYWKQWKQPRTRRRHLLALGIPREEVHMATRSRKGYWRMSSNSILQRALTNRWLQACAFAGGSGGTRKAFPTVSRRSPKGEDGHAHIMDYSSLRAGGPCLIGTAVCRPARAVVWHS